MGDEGAPPPEKLACCAEGAAEPLAASLGVLHPLSPLSREEIAAATAAVLAAAAPEAEEHGRIRFESVELCEPPRADVRAFDRDGGGFARTATVVFFHEGRVGVRRWRVSLGAEAEGVGPREHFPEARPMVQREESKRATDALRADAAFIAACARRGVTDMERVHIAPWPAGFIDGASEEERALCEGRHVGYVFVWARSPLFEKDNYNTVAFGVLPLAEGVTVAGGRADA